ncbi:MAG: hypothetical protein SFW62_06335 [Alphaproteobacteria bacterium]|nr:hypothetical protein [Alphaproteobacteria bacterium]
MQKKRHKPRIATVRIGEKPTPERRNQNGGVISEIVDRGAGDKILVKRYRAVWECPLDTYLCRRVISEQEYRAGLKFRHAYFRAVLGIKVDNIGSGSGGDREMAMLTPIYSERLLNDAYEALSFKQKEIVISVCGHDEVVGETAKLKTLHRGLERLCDVWKIRELA